MIFVPALFIKSIRLLKEIKEVSGEIKDFALNELALRPWQGRLYTLSCCSVSQFPFYCRAGSGLQDACWCCWSVAIRDISAGKEINRYLLAGIKYPPALLSMIE
jgi:hypothetical protein